MGDGTGCDNMTCIIVTFGDRQKAKRERDENEVETSEPMNKRVRVSDDGNDLGNEASV